MELLQILNLLYQHFLITLVMKTLSKAMNTVHKVETPKGLCAIQISTFWLMMSIGQWRQRHTNMQQQLDHFALRLLKMEINKTYAIWSWCRVYQRSLYLNGATNDFHNIKVVVPKGVDGQTKDMLERCMVTYGRAAGTRAKMRSRATKGSISPRSTRNTANNLLKQKHLEYKPWVDNEVFWSHRHEEGQAENLCDRTMGAHHQDGQARATSSEQRPNGY